MLEYNPLGGGIDADAQAFITAASITDSTQQSAINTLVTQLKGYGIWTKMKALYPFVGGSAASHKWNLKDPRDLDAAYRLVFNGGWTHSSTGALPNGTTGYANTLFIPSVDFSGLVDNSGVTYYNAVAGNPESDGCYSTNTRFLFGATTSSVDIRMNTDANTPNTYSYSSTGTGTFTVTKNGTTTVNTYHNGNLIDSTSKVSALVSKPIFIGARNQDGTPGYYFSQEKRFLGLHTGLNSSEVLALKNLIQTYQTSLGRQV